MNNISQKEVVKFLVGKRFNCIAQPKSGFPDIIAWKPLMDQNGKNLELCTKFQDGKVASCTPFFITMIKCKTSKHLTKKEKINAKELLDKNACNVFLVAYKSGKKLEFQEFFSKSKEVKNERTQNYIG